MIHRLVIENLKHRPVRTLLSAIAIGVQVTMILTLVGVSRGMLHDMAQRARGTGADVLVRPPGSSIIGFSGVMPEKIKSVVLMVPHVVLVTGTLVQPVGNISSITGINLDEFNTMSGGFRFLEGGPFQAPQDLIVDEVFARSEHVHVGDHVDQGVTWRVAGVVESGKLSRMFAQLRLLQDLFSATGKVSVIYVKVDSPANIPVVIDSLKKKLEDYKVYSVEEFTSLISVDNIPLLRRFIGVVIALAVIVGFLVVFLSMYTAVLERTREIGILKALGASPGYILGILVRETILLAVAGTVAGILMSYGTRALMQVMAPTMTQVIVPDWWPWAALISLIGSLIGALYPGLKAARQDAIEALAYD
ncbi:MAG TPA: FtsX-like permease family protein [Bryobacteraceae bacterium]|nr:FtsX-like permease family protein [Bryobacteraceae bacterium]